MGHMAFDLLVQRHGVFVRRSAVQWFGVPGTHVEFLAALCQWAAAASVSARISSVSRALSSMNSGEVLIV